MCVCVSLCTTVVHNTAQNSSDNFPLILQTIIMAQMMSKGGEGDNRIDVRQLPAVAEKRVTGHPKSTRCHVFYKVL